MKKSILASLLALAPLCPSFCFGADQSMQMMASLSPYKAKNFNNLLGMPGFSDQLLKMHFKLYEGYVTNTNLLIDAFKNYSMKAPLDIYSFGALKRRFGWEFDGMRLHELYF